MRAWLCWWLGCLAVFYPLSWLATSAVGSAPPLVRAAVSGFGVQRVDVSLAGVSVFPGRPAGRRTRPIETVAVVVILSLAAAAVSRKRPELGGLAMALLASGAMGPMLARWLFSRQLAAESRVALGVLFVVLWIGLRRMVLESGASRFGVRAGSLFAAYVLPSAALPILIYGRAFTGQYWLVSLAPGALAALLAAARPLGKPEIPKLSWTPVVVGLSASVALVAAVRQHGLAAEQARLLAHEAVMASLPKPPPNGHFPKVFFQRGVNFTSEFPSVYGSDGARQMLRRLPAFGINAVALVPYGFNARGSTRVGFPGGMEPDGGIEELAAVAHALGVKVMLKPQLWVRGSYTGDLDFADARARAQWFAEYRRFLEHYAALAKRIHADVFCIGVEFAKLTRYEAEWRALIAAARAIYPGPLVYAAATGPDFENAAFWDALDYIGLNDYYPLPDDLAADGVVRKVEAVQRKFGRPVLFTEAGFASLEAPHREPWDERRRKLSPEDQARCYEAVFRAFYDKPWFQGMYWWKVGSNGAGGPEDGSHTPWEKPAMELMKRWFLQGGR